MNSPKCLIMLASWNGEKYIEKQIKSILNQTYSNFDLLIRDDGSTDETMKIINALRKIDSRIILIENKSDLHGAYHNFHELIVKAKSMKPYDYYLFSDQDDVWVDTKIEKLVDFMRKKCQDKPAMVYSDLSVIDGDDNLLNTSISSSLGLDLGDYVLNEFFIHAYVWGCASILNRKLFQMVPPLDHTVKVRNRISHDNYYAKSAIAFGSLLFYDEPLVLHRRHRDNVSESHRLKMSPSEIIRQGTVGLDNLAQKHAKVYSQTLFTIQYLRQHHLNAEILDVIEAVITKGGLKGIRFFMDHKIKRKQKSRTIGLYLIMLIKKYKKYLFSL